MELQDQKLQYIASHGEKKQEQDVLRWNVAAIVLGTCRSGDRRCGACNCQELITRAGGNTIDGEYTIVSQLPDIRKALEIMS